MTPSFKLNLAKFKILTKFDLNQWHLVVYFSKKIILVKTWYKTYNTKFLPIIKAFKT